MTSTIGRPRVPKLNGYTRAYYEKQLRRNESKQDTVRRKHGPGDSRLKKMAATAEKYRECIRELEEMEKTWTADRAAPGQENPSPKRLPAHCHMTVYGVGMELGGEIIVQSPAIPPSDDPLYLMATRHRDEWLQPRRGIGFTYTGPLIAPEEDDDG